MSDDTQDLTPGKPSLDELLVQVVAAEEAGRPIDGESLAAKHPQFAAELREFIANRRRMQQLAAPLREAAPGGGASNGHARGTIRYFGDYELLDEIAAGGMGIVYKARQVSLNRIVAVKMILKGTLATEDDVKRFRAEAEAAASLQHPGIVAIHEVGLHEGQHYFSMDYVDGQSLASLPREKPLSARQAAEFVREAAVAVHAAHQQGTLHRDLKPSNILIDRQGRVRITDFGLAKQITGNSDLTLTGQILGTPSYMPPEQALSKRSLIGTASDVYSLGAVLYELLAGRPPFRGESPAETLRQVETLDPISPRLLSPTTPRDLETICLKCLDKEPHKRYATAQLLADDLIRFLRGEPIHARRARAWERGLKWVRRHPTAAGMVLASTVALLALVGVAVGQSYNRRLQTLNNALASAKASLEIKNSQLERAKTSLESSNRKLESASAKLEHALTDAQGERAKARRYLYAARMALVQRAERENQIGRVVQLLRSVIPDTADQEDLREFEWNYLWRKYHGEESRVRGHMGPVTAVAFSPDDRWVASGSADRSIRIWDLGTGLEHRRFAGHQGEVKSIAFSKEGDRLISASEDGSLRLWSLQTGQELRSFTDALPVNEKPRLTACTFSSDGLHVACSSEKGTVRVWDVSTGKMVDEWTGQGIEHARGLAFHPDGRTLAGGNSNGVKFWQPLDRQIRPLHDVPASPGRTNTNLAFSPDGKRVIWGYTVPASSKGPGPNGRVTVWDVESNALVWSLGFPGIVMCVAYSPSGDSFAAAGLEQSVRIWNATTGEESCALFAQDAIRSIAYSPDGSRLAAGTEDRMVMLWSLPKHEQRTLQEGVANVAQFPALANSVSFGARGQALAAVYKGQVLVWDGRTGRPIQQMSDGGIYRRIAVAPRGDWIAGASRRGVLREVFTGKETIHLQGSGEEQENGALAGSMAYAISQDETLVAVASGKKLATVYRVSTGEPVRSFELREWVSSVAFSPDARLLAVGSAFWSPGADNRGKLQVWETATGNVVLPMQSFPLDVWWLAFSPDGSLLAAAMGDYQDVGADLGRVRIWNTATWEVVHDLRGHSRCVWSLAFNPRGTRLASAGGQWYRRSTPCGEVKLWDTTTGEELLTIPDPNGAVYGVAFSPDGRQLATASQSGAVTLFDGTRLVESPLYSALPAE